MSDFTGVKSYAAHGICAFVSQNSVVAKVHQDRWMRNVLDVDAESCGNSCMARTFCHLSTVYRIKKYEYPQLAPTVLRDERLRQAVEAAAQLDYGKPVDGDDPNYTGLLQRHEARATKILWDMRSTMSDFFLRVTSWLLYKLLPCFLTSVVAHPAQIQMLKKASDTGLPLIFLPSHRSHLDYILTSFILLNNNIRPPLVAAGDNLRIPLIGWMLRALGAFFIKRRMDPVQGRRDTVYRAVLHTYMMECLRAGHNLEFFIEGGRTRTGKSCLPKGGLLSVIVDAYMDGTIEDALLVPVSVNYEKLVDGNFVREQLGQPKQMETFGKAMKSVWSVLNSNYGMMRIDFNQPFSLRFEPLPDPNCSNHYEYEIQNGIHVELTHWTASANKLSCKKAKIELVRSFHACNKEKFRSNIPDGGGGGDVLISPIPNGEPKPKKSLHSVPSSASLYGTDIVAEEHRQLVESIARHVVYDCSESTAVMSTNAVAFLLLNRFRNGVTMEKLVEAMERLKKDLFYSGRDVGFTGEMVDVINHACDLLGPGLVRRERILKDNAEPFVMVRPFTMAPNVIELSYYSNALLSHFVLDGVVDDVRSSRPTTATNEAIAQRVRNVVRDDRRKTIKEIAAEVGISVGSVHNVLHKHLNMHYVYQKLVPKMLSAEQKETRMTLAGDMISMADEDGDFLNKIIAGDETWCYLYDPVPKRQSSEWKSKTSPRKQKFPRDTSKGKVMLEVFFDSQGLIHHEFIPEGRTVTKELYVEILRRLRDAVRRKRPEKWVEKNWFLMHDNAPAHRAIIVKNFLARHNITALDHPPYSPDLSPPDYFLFPRLKSHLKGRRFNVEENCCISDAHRDDFVVTVTSLFSLLSADTSQPVMSGCYRVLNFTEGQILQCALELCEVLQFEFIFTKPCKQLETAIEEAISQLRYKEIIMVHEPVYSEEQQWSMRYARNFDDEDSDSGEDSRSSRTLMLDTREEALENLEFYRCLLQPLIDVYAVSALGLQRLVGRQLTERDYMQELLAEMKTQLKMGFAQYEESVSVDPFKNSLKLFERWDILECLSHDRIKLYYLRDEYDSERSVQTVFDKVKRFKWAASSVS
ncbi:hypothetical protein ANN_27324 [Periplaneta americana]|uniref:Phospholipid/glycerol acyltransferase domain-containing protein n=1 Tax=Periplaneta americana TaxID=6978 RepID=A0ABQ8RY98_PERAM|nr:hypothetical protein ANN_27324 [Periplaneta americana]